jgi:branched-chain amino acid transport system permease protein
VRNLPSYVIWSALYLWPTLSTQTYIFHIATTVAIFITLGLSLNVMFRIGQLSLLQGAMFGVGAYASALLTMRLGFGFPLAFLCSGVIAAGIAGLVGPVFLRVKGVYFLLLTFAFGQIILLVFTEWSSLFGGANGLVGIPASEIFGISFAEPARAYYLALSVALLSFLFVRWLFLSEFGTVLDALSEDERLAASLGSSTLAYRVVAFAFSAFLAGISGSLYAHFLSFLVPESFSFKVDTDLILLNVLGGVSTPLGPVLGALLVVPLPELLRSVADYQTFAYGLLLIILQLFLPNGLVPVLKKGSSR